jgi:4'-phosphopantetheinyl transferase
MVKVFALKIPTFIDSKITNSFLKLIGEKKRRRIERFRHIEDAYRSLLGEVLARKIIEKMTGIPSDKIKILQDHYGKPFLAEFEDIIHFNISHSGEWVAVIIDSASVGIDVEEIVPINLVIAPSIFSIQENLDLWQKPERERIGYFYDLWTLKECYLKAVGIGLSLPTKTFTIRKLSKGTIEIDPPTTRFCFKQYELDPKYKLSVCSTSPHLPDRIEVLCITDLL